MTTTARIGTGNVLARDLIAGGYCTPQCLLALFVDHDRAVCKCRCDGSGHGLLADAEVEFDTAAANPGSLPILAAGTMACDLCGRPIAKGRTHIVARAERGLVVLSFCCLPGNSMGLHGELWPSCQQRWHDFYDHPSMAGSRAGIALALRSERADELRTEGRELR